MGNLTQKGSAYPKRETDTNILQNIADRLQKTTKVGLTLQSLLINYKSQTQTKNLIDGLQKTTKVGHRLQSLLKDYKRLQKLDLDYKVYW